MSCSVPSALPRHLVHRARHLQRCCPPHAPLRSLFSSAARCRVGAALCTAAQPPRHTLCTSSRLYTTRDASGFSASREEPEIISLDCIEVITTTVETSHANTAAAAAGVEADSPPSSFSAASSTPAGAAVSEGRPQHHHHHQEQPTASPRSAATSYCDVRDVDTFARGRIVNFVRRMGHTKGDVFQVRKVQETCGTAGTTSSVFIATCHVPLPAPHHSHVAEGVGESAKEAELLAAMHAERVCDALGVPLFRLRSAQQKHAEAVRFGEGRYAPMPDDPVKPLGTPVPPPLRLLRTPAEAPPPASSSATVGDAQEERQRTQHGGRASSSSVPHHPRGTPEGKGSAAAAASPVADAAATPGQGGAPSPSPAIDPASTSAATHAEDLSEWPTPTATPFLSTDASRNETHRCDARLVHNTFVTSIDDATHAERVAAYASTVVYPWERGWVEAQDAAAPMRGESRATAYGVTTSVNFDHTEGGLWQMVNDRNLRCSPTPADALVLPYVFDGPFAVARLTEYYVQHGTTLGEHLTVRSVPVPGSMTRLTEVELRLVGVTVTARGKSHTEELAVGLAAMHAELLLDALGLPLFPADPARQARHAAAVIGYGRWATDPLTGATASPNPHDTLPLPLKSQVGMDDVWLDASMPAHQRSKRTESEHIIAAQNFLIHKADSMLEMNPPTELLEEAYAMLQDWQRDIARSRYTNLFVLFNMESNTFRATTITPVPARFGLRGGNSVAPSPESAVRLCALNAMETLVSLGVPLCVDAERERRYLQRRAAMGQLLPTMADGAGSLIGGISSLPGVNRTTATRMAKIYVGDAAAQDAVVPYLPSYVWEGQSKRIMPAFIDYQHVTQLRVPQDYCLFSDASDKVLDDVGTDATTCVRNYLEHQHALRMQDVRVTLRTLGVIDARYRSATGSPPTDKEDEVSRLACAIGSPAAAADRAALRDDDLLQTQLWALLHYPTTAPSVYFTGYVSTVAVHSVAFLRIPVVHQRRRDATASAETGESCLARLEGLLNDPDYVIAVGISLKRRHAVRACYVHAVTLLKRMGVDVLASFSAHTARTRYASTCEALAQYVTDHPPCIVPPFNSDGETNTTPLEVPASPLSAKQRPPLAVMHKNLKQFMEDPRHFTQKRRRGGGKRAHFAKAPAAK